MSNQRQPSPAASVGGGSCSVQVLGALVGDIVGSTYEFNNIKSQDFPLFPDGSRFTDDSVMTLAVAQALMDAMYCGQPISTALVHRMQELGNRYPGAGYGGLFSAWLGSANPAPYNSWGNGSAMRVSPVGWVANSLEAAEFLAAETAKVTHNHGEGIRGAQAVAGCIVLARQGASNEQIRTYLRERIGYNLDFTLDQIRPSYTFDVSCQGSVPQAVMAFLEGAHFEDVVRKAVSLGGDSDTIAAIAASLAHARFGVPDALAASVRALLTPDLLVINDEFCTAFRVD